MKKVQDYLIPINAVPQKAKKYEYTEEEMAKVDGQLCNDLIGKVCNLARDLQSLYWHLYNTGTEENKQKYLPMIYDDICLLEVLSNIAIDSAKRRYDCNVSNVMNKIKRRSYMTVTGAIIKDDTIMFTETRYKKILSEAKIKEYEDYVKRRNEATSIEEIEELNKEIENTIMKTVPQWVSPDFTQSLKSKPKKKKKRSKNETDEQKELNRQKQIALAQEQKMLKERIYRKLESPMDILKSLIEEKVVRCDRTNYLTSFVEILKPIPKETKADYNRIKAIKEVCIEAKKSQDYIQSEYDSNRKSFDEMYEEKKTIEKDVINDIKSREVTTWDIHKLIRDVFDIHPKKDKHGKIERDSEGKVILVDKRDNTLIDSETGGLLLQWVYAAHTDKFLETIKDSGHGTISYVKKYEPKNETSTKINSFKDLGKILKEDNREIFELDGEKYVIEKRHPKKVKKAV